MTFSDLQALEHAAAMFHDDERGCHLQSPLFDLEINLRIWSPESHPGAQSAIRHIHHDLWQAACLVSRLEWMRAMCLEKKLDESLWRHYSQLDIQAFLVDLRSMMDYSVVMIDSFAPKPNQLPDSFRKLRESVDKYGARLPKGVETLLKSANWFDSIRSIRDALVHQGAEPMVFCGAADGILFQIHTAKTYPFFSRSGFMYNENVVYFDRFAAWAMAHTLCFLDSLGHLFYEHTRQEKSVGPASSYCMGFDELRRWMRSFSHAMRVDSAAGVPASENHSQMAT